MDLIGLGFLSHHCGAQIGLDKEEACLQKKVLENWTLQKLPKNEKKTDLAKYPIT